MIVFRVVKNKTSVVTGHAEIRVESFGDWKGGRSVAYQGTIRMDWCWCRSKFSRRGCSDRERHCLKRAHKSCIFTLKTFSILGHEVVLRFILFVGVSLVFFFFLFICLRLFIFVGLFSQWAVNECVTREWGWK